MLSGHWEGSICGSPLDIIETQNPKFNSKFCVMMFNVEKNAFLMSFKLIIVL